MKRGITARHFIKALQKDGFTETRVSGSHHRFKHPDRATMVSFHKRSNTFPVGTLKGMVEDVQWNEEDLRRHDFL